MTGQFPRKLSQLRRERELNQKTAAEKLGVSQALLSHYENGAREPGLDFIVNAAAFYEVSTDYLLGVSDERRPGGENADISKALDFFGSASKNMSEQSRQKARNWMVLAIWKLVKMVTGTDEDLERYASLAIHRAQDALNEKIRYSAPDDGIQKIIAEAEELIKQEMRD